MLVIAGEGGWLNGGRGCGVWDLEVGVVDGLLTGRVATRSGEFLTIMG